MRLRNAVKVFSILMIAVMFMLGSIGCTKYASEEDLKQLETQQQAALSAEQKRDQLIKEKKQLEAQLAAKQQELKAAKAEKKKVEQRVEEKKSTQQRRG